MIRIQLLLFSLLIKPYCACLATVETSTTTLAATTTAAEDTTAEVTTAATTAAATGCTSCTMDQVTIVEDPVGEPDEAIPFVGVLETPTTVDGCLSMAAVCGTDNPAEVTFMEFQDLIAGPAFLNPVTAQLICNDDGIWTYTENGVTTTVTELHCYRTG